MYSFVYSLNPFLWRESGRPPSRTGLENFHIHNTYTSLSLSIYIYIYVYTLIS